MLESTFYRYHCSTKHTVEKLLSGGHYLDWANQPNPFRHYIGAPVVPLSPDVAVTESNYFDVLQYSWAANTASAKPPNTVYEPQQFLSNLLFYSMAISAWKQIVGTDHKWALRVNASSGNLHPTETHVAVRSLPGFDPGIYHYVVDEHKLEARARGDQADRLWKLVKHNGEDCPPVLLCLTSILWREIWKYRARGFRYCQHDMGHALGACIVSAACLGWRPSVHGIFDDDTVASVLELKDTDEIPALIIGLTPHQSMSLGSATGEGFTRALAADVGEPNVLSGKVITYRIVEEARAVTSKAKEGALDETGVHPDRPATLVVESEDVPIPFDAKKASAGCVDGSAHTTVRRRRSAVDMDGKRNMSLEQLATIMSGSTRGFSADFQQPLAVQPNGTGTIGHYLVDLFVYIHRVDDLDAGLYFFDRRKQALVPLLRSDQREMSKAMSCFQDIAADGSFAVSMIADLALAQKHYGERGYRLVHYEAGMIGQLLYLSAAALGFDSTGIGCFVDDAINHYLALPEGQEVIYNFTVGGAVHDPRLTSLPAYPFSDPALTGGWK